MNFEEIYNKNMLHLKQCSPVIYQNLLSADISAYELLIEENNEINISVNGHKIYPENVNESIQKQVDTFIQKPTSYFRKPSWCLDTEEGSYHDDLIVNLEKSSPYMAEKKDFEGYSHNLEGFIPLLIVFGIGSGLHIQKLIDKAEDISDIIIVDENYELLKISMHIIDWTDIFSYFEKNHRTLHFVIHNNNQENAHSILNTIFKNFPYYFFNINFITHYQSNFLTSVKDILLKKINLGITGMGFFDDEIESLKHTIKNLSDNIPILKYTDKLPDNSVAFIVGSGPSIDQDIETIKKLKDKAVIFSCGSSLKILYSIGIVPDYHLEQERDDIQSERITKYIPQEYLDKVNVIGLNVVSTDVYELFKSSKMFFRLNDAGSSISPKNIPHLDHCNPTVVNATVSFASTIGFDNIFLFGADMGYKDPENHHSKNSDYYNTKSESLKFDELKGTIVSKFPGNFIKDEKFYTKDGYIWCKQRVENCIYEHNITNSKSINYFNCSDGLAIDHCTPIHSKNIHISKDLSKAKVLEEIENSFDRNSDNNHKALHQNYSNQLEIFIDDINSVVKLIKAQKVKSFGQFFILMKRIFFIICHIDVEKTSFFSRSMLRGTTFHFISSVYTHALACSNLKISLKYINESLVKYLKFLDIAKQKISSFQSQLLK